MRSWLRLLVVGLAMAVMAGSVGGALAQAQAPAAEGYAHPEWFAEVDWLRDRLGDENLAVVALTPAEEFAVGHIPGAAQIDWKALEVVETSDASMANWQSAVETILAGLGVDRGDTVVVYDGGSFIAARLW
jgi:3-mercaptopyruvate sulfurtransferase SseA